MYEIINHCQLCPLCNFAGSCGWPSWAATTTSRWPSASSACSTRCTSSSTTQSSSATSPTRSSSASTTARRTSASRSSSPSSAPPRRTSRSSPAARSYSISSRLDLLPTHSTPSFFAGWKPYEENLYVAGAGYLRAFMSLGKTFLKCRGRIQRGKKPLENPPENPPENQLEISYIGKSPKIGSLDMS